MNTRANIPTFESNVFVPGGRYTFNGILNDTAEFIEKFQLLDSELWEKFAEQFRISADSDDFGWRGEFWGKMMRAGAFVYSYTQNEKLYEVLEKSIVNIISTADDSGRISTYSTESEFDGWDMWCRKYVLLGLQYFLEICKSEELSKKIITAMCRACDYIIERIGEGKKPICEASRTWRGLNSSSILEPVVRLFNITGEKRYFDFAEYIVNIGGTSVVNIFELAYEGKLYPYQYPITKAYEMISCFEGLLEFYRITKKEEYKTSLVNFAKKLLETDFTVIGGSGCTHELFDHSSARQSNPSDSVMQETCVTVTLMKFFYQMNMLTGDPTFADAFELSLYNAYLGAVNTNKNTGVVPDGTTPVALPFDSYSPITPGKRGRRIGGFKVMADGSYYGCCACIGALGIGLAPKMGTLRENDGFVVNLYNSGTIVFDEKCGISADITTEYPRDGKVLVHIKSKCPKKFTLKLRNPDWSKNTKVYLNKESYPVCQGYIAIEKEWADDTIEIEFDMTAKVIRPIPYGHDIIMTQTNYLYDYLVCKYDEEHPLAHCHIAIKRGPVLLALDSRFGYDPEDIFKIKLSDETVDVKSNEDGTFLLPTEDGGYITACPYADAGKDWDDKIAVFFRKE